MLQYQTRCLHCSHKLLLLCGLGGSLRSRFAGLPAKWWLADFVVPAAACMGCLVSVPLQKLRLHITAVSDSTAIAEPDLTAIAEPESTAIAVPDSTAIAVPDSTAIAEPDLTAIAEPESTAIAEPDLTTLAEPDLTETPDPALAPASAVDFALLYWALGAVADCTLSAAV